MMLKRLARACLIAAFFALFSAGHGFAHSLPGSILTLGQADEGLNLSISLPLEDLTIAAPHLDVLLNVSLDQDLNDKHLELLDDYFSDHLTLHTQSTAIHLTLQHAKLITGYNEHVGTHVLLTLGWTAQLDWAGHEGALSVTYDAVMHEVRNHRAAIFWAGSGDQPVGLAEFGFRRDDGAPVPVILQLPDAALR